MTPTTIRPSAEARRLAERLAASGIEDFELAVVLGSGLGDFAERLEEAHEVPFAAIEGMPASRVPGHAGRFVLGKRGGTRILVQEGRVHLYEGWTASEASLGVRAYAELGCARLLLTNAAGGTERDWAPPCLMRITDHLNLQGETPLTRSEGGRGSPYDTTFGELLDAAARDVGVELRRGVYAGLLGPAYETPAEVRLAISMGAQALGMSTVAEALAGWAAGLRVAAISCITNLAAGVGDRPLRHEDVVAAAATVAADFERLLERVVDRRA